MLVMRFDVARGQATSLCGAHAETLMQILGQTRHPPVSRTRCERLARNLGMIVVQFPVFEPSGISLACVVETWAGLRSSHRPAAWDVLFSPTRPRKRGKTRTQSTVHASTNGRGRRRECRLNESLTGLQVGGTLISIVELTTKGAKFPSVSTKHGGKTRELKRALRREVRHS